MRTVFASPRRQGGVALSDLTQSLSSVNHGTVSHRVARPSSTDAVPSSAPSSVPSDGRMSSPLPSLPVASSIPPGLLPPGLTARLLSSLESAHHHGYVGFLEEIRLRANRHATLTIGGYNCPTDLLLRANTLADLLVHLCGGSLYAYSDTIHQGFLTLPGGIRVGVAGRAVCENNHIIGVTDITSLSIRLPHPQRAVGGVICRLLHHLRAEGQARGVLIYAPPGIGKTTLLRAVAAAMASGPNPWRTVVVDTRGELGFDTDAPDLCLDVLTGYPRARGVEIATRTLSAELIICDEIGDVEEAMALISAHHGGVPLVASAHAATPEELLRRTGIRLLHEARLFGAYVGIRRAGCAWPAEAGWGSLPTPAAGAATSAPPPASETGMTAENPPNPDFHRGRDRGSTVVQPSHNRGSIEDKTALFLRNSTKRSFAGAVDARRADVSSPAHTPLAPTADYLYRITPWADAERLVGGV